MKYLFQLGEAAINPVVLVILFLAIVGFGGLYLRSLNKRAKEQRPKHLETLNKVHGVLAVIAGLLILAFVGFVIYVFSGIS